MIKSPVSRLKTCSAMDLIFALTLLLYLPTYIHSEEPLAKIVVRAGKPFQVAIPISVTLENSPESLAVSSLCLEEIRDSQSIPIPSQLEDGDSPRLWWIVTGEPSAGIERIYTLKRGRQKSAPLVELRMDGKGLEFSMGESRVLRYNYAPIPPPESESPLYTRSGFIHPIWTPEGKVLSRIHPSDHIHHMGFWNPWTKTEFEGRKVDFWNLKDGQGTVRFVRFATLESGPVFASLEAIQEYIDFTTPEGEGVVLNEVWAVRVWNLGEGDRRVWMWDFTTIQRCATDKPLTILKYRYGGFGFRGTSDWDKNNSDFLTSEGKTRVDGNGTRGRWCNIYGQLDEGSAGMVFLSHPENHEHPEPMRIWPEGDVFFGFCPVVYAEWKLVPGNEYDRQYRMIVYDGTMATDEIEQYWEAFAHPPEVEIEWSDK